MTTNPATDLVARSNRLGADPRNTNYAGGNASAKGAVTDPVTQQPIELMWVKGSGGDLGTLTESGQDWDLRHDVVAKGSFLVSRAAAKMMIDQGLGGDIIYISSKNAVFAGPNNVAYGAAKADQAHQVRLLAAELGGHGIRVNGINPDGVVRDSGIFAGGWGAKRAAVYGVPEEELGAYYAGRTLLKREVRPEHVAAAVFALTTGDLSMTTGLHIPVDSGLAAAFLR